MCWHGFCLLSAAGPPRVPASEGMATASVLEMKCLLSLYKLTTVPLLFLCYIISFDHAKMSHRPNCSGCCWVLLTHHRSRFSCISLNSVPGVENASSGQAFMLHDITTKSFSSTKQGFAPQPPPSCSAASLMLDRGVISRDLTTEGGVMQVKGEQCVYRWEWLHEPKGMGRIAPTAISPSSMLPPAALRRSWPAGGRSNPSGNS